MTTPLRIILIQDGKDVENRARSIVGAYRGPILIHAAARVDYGALTGAERPKIRPGRRLGVVELIDVHHASTCADATNERTSTGLCSEWTEDDGFHLVMRNPAPSPSRSRTPAALASATSPPPSLPLSERSFS